MLKSLIVLQEEERDFPRLEDHVDLAVQVSLLCCLLYALEHVLNFSVSMQVAADDDRLGRVRDGVVS